MKKLCICLFVGIFCFFGFSTGVKADYEPVCYYEGKTTKIYIFYDNSSSDKLYKFTLDRQMTKSNDNFSSDKKNYEIELKGDTVVKHKEGQFKGTNVYSYSAISATKCPKNVWTFDDSNSMGLAMCFYDDNPDKCKNESAFYYNEMIMGTDSNGETVLEKNEKQYHGSAISGGKYTTVKVDDFTNGKVCTVDFHLYGSNRDTVCPVSFGIKNGGLVILHNDDVVYGTEIDCSETIEVALTRDSTKTKPQKIRKTIHLDNVGVGLPTNSLDVLVSNRVDFDKKFLEYWEKAGAENCGSILYYDKNGDSWDGTAGDGIKNLFSVGDQDYYLLFEDAKDLCSTADCDNVKVEDYEDLKDFDSLYSWPKWYDTSYSNCEELIGKKIVDFINEILLYIRILVPILLIGLGVADFVKAMISSDESAMSKAKNKFFKRLIVAAVIFLIPSITNLLFDLVNGVWAHINNGACNIWN